MKKMALMDFFKRSGKPLDLTLTNVTLSVGLTLIIIQAFGLIFGQMLGIDIKLGPIVVMISVLIAAFLGIVVLKKLLEGQPIARNDMLSIVIVTIVALIFMFLLKDYVPQIFSVGAGQLQSMVGLG